VKTLNTEDTIDKTHCKAAHTGNVNQTIKEMVEFLTSIPSRERDCIFKLLAHHNKAVSRGPHDVGEVTEVKHSISTGGSSPTRQQPCRVPFHQHKAIRQEVEAMLQSDVIEPSTSPWCAPVILVVKKDRLRRFCVNYRKLNEVTKKDVYPSRDVKKYCTPCPELPILLTWT
jgi:hypothetical protein